MYGDIGSAFIWLAGIAATMGLLVGFGIGWMVFA